MLSFFLLAPLLAGSTNIDALMDGGHWKRARALTEAAYRANPNDAHANYLMSRVKQRFGAIEEAEKFAETAVKLDPKVSAHHRMLGETAGELAQKASVFKQLGLARKIRAEFETALSLDPKDPENILNEIQFFLEAPGIMGGDKPKAMQLANDEVKSDPVHGYIALARIAQTEKHPEQLEALYLKAVAADPKSYDAQTALAVYYANKGSHGAGGLGDPVKTEAPARAAMELMPDRVGGYRLLAYALAGQKRADDAAKIVARAEAAVPDDLSPYVLAARAFLMHDAELPRAEAYLKKYLSETTEPEPSAPPLHADHYWLAMIYDKQGKKSEAIAELQTALKIKPDFEAAKKELKRIKG